ncbi:hypothetical protein Amsp01_073750 [Amycolatopsis sp. NBRC 101858]|nr:hypothetical protein Amsp01_073750 [Amycolatopsis sp. NBRC 101858]
MTGCAETKLKTEIAAAPTAAIPSAGRTHPPTLVTPRPRIRLRETSGTIPDVRRPPVPHALRYEWCE